MLKRRPLPVRTPVVQVVPQQWPDGSTSNSVDVWDSDADLCAYCAHPMTVPQRRCLSCGRRLTYSFYRYAKASPNLHILWVLLAGLGQLYLISLVLLLVSKQEALLVAVHATIAVVSLVLAAGVYFRVFLAYPGTLLFVVALVFLLSLGLLDVELQIANDSNLVFRSLVSPIGTLLGNAVNRMQTAAAVLALIWAAVMVGSDFTRDEVQLTARLERGLVEPSTLFAAGNRFAERGMWATAVLHWRQAAARYPTNGYYLKALGDGYIRLGFSRRGLDALRMAIPGTVDEKERQRLVQHIADVERSIAAN